MKTFAKPRQARAHAPGQEGTTGSQRSHDGHGLKHCHGTQIGHKRRAQKGFLGSKRVGALEQ